MDAIEHYRPQLPCPVWERIGADCRRAVTRAKPSGPKEARDWLGALAYAAAYADACGRSTAAEKLLTPEAIEWFLATGCGHLSEASRGNRRGRLNRLRRALFGPDLLTGQPAAYTGSDSSRPYSKAEQSRLYSSARFQPTAELRFGCLTLLALGFGCALDSPEIIPLRTHDVRTAPNGAVAVAVRGRRSRLVLCRASWAVRAHRGCRLGVSTRRGSLPVSPQLLCPRHQHRHQLPRSRQDLSWRSGTGPRSDPRHLAGRRRRSPYALVHTDGRRGTHHVALHRPGHALRTQSFCRAGSGRAEGTVMTGRLERHANIAKLRSRRTVVQDQEVVDLLSELDATGLVAEIEPLVHNDKGRKRHLNVRGLLLGMCPVLGAALWDGHAQHRRRPARLRPQ